MPLERFGLENLAVLEDGKIIRQFDRHLNRMAADCADRPGDPAPRKLVMTLEIIPICDSDGSCLSVNAVVHMKSDMPAHRTLPINLGLHPGGYFLVNPDSPRNVHQQTFQREEE